MGGEGSMAAANASLKNNRSQIKRKERNALSGSYSNVELKEFPKATEAQIQAVKEKIQKQNKERNAKSLLIFVVALALGILFFSLY